jgi:uncharacterized protein YodC (DUF2158 family)
VKPVIAFDLRGRTIAGLSEEHVNEDLIDLPSGRAGTSQACCREARRIMLPTLRYPQVRHRNRATSIHPRQYRESYSAMARPCHTQTWKDLGFAMMMLTKKAVPVIAAMLGVAVSTSWAVPVLAGPAQSSTTMQSRAAPLLKRGDLVRLRSGGPVLTVKSVRDGWVICSWLTDYGELQSGGFPIAMVEGPVTPPPDDANAETNGLSQE